MKTPRRVRQRVLNLEEDTSLVGIDVGECFLDLAILRESCAIDYDRIDLRELGSDAISAVVHKLKMVCPTDRCVALVDSPRSPRDVDVRVSPGRADARCPSGRAIDRALHEFVFARVGSRLRFSLFPTPALDYFNAWIRQPDAKTHLRAFYSALFQPAQNTGLNESSGKPSGGTFTRFMLSGFAVHRGLARLGIECYECFPDLVFKIWNGGRTMPSKRDRSAALSVRQRINRELRSSLKITEGSLCANLDQADAEVMVLAAASAVRSGSLTILDCPAEGGFLLPLPN
jgi:hypothetical protein